MTKAHSQGMQLVVDMEWSRLKSSASLCHLYEVSLHDPWAGYLALRSKRGVSSKSATIGGFLGGAMIPRKGFGWEY
jgi:hypothetical protein